MRPPLVRRRRVLIGGRKLDTKSSRIFSGWRHRSLFRPAKSQKQETGEETATLVNWLRTVGLSRFNT